MLDYSFRNGYNSRGKLVKLERCNNFLAMLDYSFRNEYDKVKLERRINFLFSNTIASEMSIIEVR